MHIVLLHNTSGMVVIVLPCSHTPSFSILCRLLRRELELLHGAVMGAPRSFQKSMDAKPVLIHPCHSSYTSFTSSIWRIRLVGQQPDRYDRPGAAALLDILQIIE